MSQAPKALKDQQLENLENGTVLIEKDNMPSSGKGKPKASASNLPVTELEITFDSDDGTTRGKKKRPSSSSSDGTSSSASDAEKGCQVHCKKCWWAYLLGLSGAAVLLKAMWPQIMLWQQQQQVSRTLLEEQHALAGLTAAAQKVSHVVASEQIIDQVAQPQVVHQVANEKYSWLNLVQEQDYQPVVQSFDGGANCSDFSLYGAAASENSEFSPSDEDRCFEIPHGKRIMGRPGWRDFAKIFSQSHLFGNARPLIRCTDRKTVFEMEKSKCHLLVRFRGGISASEIKAIDLSVVVYPRDETSITILESEEVDMSEKMPGSPQILRPMHFQASEYFQVLEIQNLIKFTETYMNEISHVDHVDYRMWGPTSSACGSNGTKPSTSTCGSNRTKPITWILNDSKPYTYDTLRPGYYESKPYTSGFEASYYEY